ncbi:hypothetical protein JL722_10499 [Aureococcus anophagefferens]|nr:hypothetical protein JL722_10499 [Aureococcus anophagefferens]
MLRFKSGSTPQAAPEGAIPDRFAHGVAVAKRKSLEGQASQSKPSVLKAVTAGARSRGNSADSDTRGSF